MTPVEAQNALQSHLQAMPGVPDIGYENGPVVGALPRVVVSMPAPPQRQRLIDGEAFGEAQLVIRIEVEDGEFAGEAEGIAADILAHFQSAQTVNGVRILRQPEIQTRYRLDGVYYMPVLVQGRYYF